VLEPKKRQQRADAENAQQRQDGESLEYAT
jgi:hypothetical protein